jgi:hypothetical protein
MKVKCPICEVEGFLEQRGNSYRIKHYVKYLGNQRKYLTHKITKDQIQTLGINGNQNLGINKLVLGLNSENMVGSLGFEPRIANAPGWYPKPS